MRSPERGFASAASLGLAAALCGCAAHGAGQWKLHALPGPSYTLRGESVEVRTPTLRIALSPVDNISRAAYIGARAHGAEDPFGPGADGTPRYMTFELDVENLSKEAPVSFQPQSILLASDSGDRIYPMDFPEAFRRLVAEGRTDPRLLDDLSKYLFDVGVSLSPGERIDRLLVYPVPKDPAKKMRMEFNFIETGGTASRSLDVYFVRISGP